MRQIGRFCCEEEQVTYLTTCVKNNKAFCESTINSLKHRILVYLYYQARTNHETGDEAALRKFYKNFNQYLALRMWKIQLLDDDHLLIKYSSEEVVTSKVYEPNSHDSYFVVYNIWKKKILAVYSNFSDELLYLLENFCDLFRNQCTCSPSNNIYANALYQKFKQTVQTSKESRRIEAIKRITSQLPIPAQSFSSSPYLDLQLFRYDERWISIMERPKLASEYPICFFSRETDLVYNL